MSFQNMRALFLGVVGICSSYAACGLPELDQSGNADGGEGVSSASGNTGAQGVGGSAGFQGAGGSGGVQGVGGSAGAGGGKPGDWWDNAWSRRVRITFHNAGGAELTDFPVMVRLDATRIQSTLVSPNGEDLRFVDSDGQTILAHELERWTSGGDSFVWVRVPKIDATDTDHIWLYYGNGFAMDSQSAAAVWKDFVSVYHLSPTTMAPMNFPDSVGANPGVWYQGQSGAIIPSLMHEAINLDGMHHIEIGENSIVAANPGEVITAEAWISTLQMMDQIIVNNEGQCVGWYLGTTVTGDIVGSFITAPNQPLCGTPLVERAVKSKATPGTWHYLVLSIDRPGAEMRLFVDGSLVGSTVIEDVGIADGNGIFRIGSSASPGNGAFVGAIDEVRVARRYRNPAWVAAQYKSMIDQFLTFEAL